MKQGCRIDQEKTYWNKLSNNYDNFIARHWNIYNSSLFDKITREISKGTVVLDVACGTGLIAEKMAAKAKNVVAVDLSENMIAQATSKQKALDIENIEYRVEDAYHLPFGDGIFDMATCINALHNMQNPEKALSEIRRVLKPGGKLIVSIVGIGTSLRFKIMFTLMRVFQKLPLPVFHKVNLNQAADIVKRAGFEVIKNEQIKDDRDMMPLLYLIAQKAYPTKQSPASLSNTENEWPNRDNSVGAKSPSAD